MASISSFHFFSQQKCHMQLFGFQAFECQFPDGPTRVEELFNWHNYNAQVLFSDEMVRNNFIQLLSTVEGLVLHEDYAGMGTAGCALVQQFQAMKRSVASFLPNGFLLCKSHTIVIAVASCQ